MLTKELLKNPSAPARVENNISTDSQDDHSTSPTDEYQKNSFSSQQIEKLIEAVRKRPILYNCFSRNSTNKVLKNTAWEEVAEFVNSDVATCQYKWKYLRDIFVKKKRAKDTNPGMYKLKPWHLLNSMMFVDPFVNLRSFGSDQKKEEIPTQVTTMFQSRKYQLKESNGGVFVLEDKSEDSPSPSAEYNSEVHHVIKLGSVFGNQSQETMDSHNRPAQSSSTHEQPSKSYEIEESMTETPSDGNEESYIPPKRRRRNETEDMLEKAITQLVNESSDAQEDYLDLRTKSLCLLIRSKNLSRRDQVNIMKQLDELVLNYKKN